MLKNEDTSKLSRLHLCILYFANCIFDDIYPIFLFMTITFDNNFFNIQLRSPNLLENDATAVT